MVTTPPNPRRFRARKAAEYIGMSASWLAKRRMRGDPPAFLKVGRAVVYDEGELDAWLRSCWRQSTSEPVR
jgi:predicted DNA-binding transcriptional regulator AlpA